MLYLASDRLETALKDSTLVTNELARLRLLFTETRLHNQLMNRVIPRFDLAREQNASNSKTIDLLKQIYANRIALALRYGDLVPGNDHVVREVVRQYYHRIIATNNRAMPAVYTDTVGEDIRDRFVMGIGNEFLRDAMDQLLSLQDEATGRLRRWTANSREPYERERLKELESILAQLDPFARRLKYPVGLTDAVMVREPIMRTAWGTNAMAYLVKLTSLARSASRPRQPVTRP